jgi:hypothetical protein
MSYRHESTDDLRRQVAYWRRREAHFVDRMNRYGPDFWHYKLNGVRIRLRNIEAEIGRREMPS